MPKKKENLSPEEKLIKALIPKEEEPYKLPDNWVWTRLIGCFAECLDNFRKPINATERAKRKGNIPYYGATGQVGFIDDYLLEGEFILLGEDGAPFLEILKNKAYKIKGKAWVNNHAHVLKSFFGEIGNEYMLHYLNIFNYKDYVNGTTRLKLTQEKMKKICIPLPPFSEQKRIVEKLDSLFEKTNRIKEIIEEVKEKTSLRREAVLSKAFTGELTEKWRAENKTENAKELLLKINEEKLKNNPKAKIKDISEMLVNEDEVPYKIPENWVWIKLGELGEYKKGPFGSSLTKNMFVPKGENTVKVYEQKNAIQKDWKLGNYYITEEYFNQAMKSFEVKEKDIIVSCAGTIGETYSLPKGIEKGIINQALMKITLNTNINEKYYLFYFDYILKRTSNLLSKGSAIKNIPPFKIFKELPFALPPLEEQKEIVRILDKVFEEENKISELISLEEKVGILEKTILDKAFRGELGTGNIDDEPAIESLKRALEENK